MSERTIFLTALDKDDAQERKAYLDGACAGEPWLRRRVEALLKSHDDAGSFLGAPIGEQIEVAAGQTEVADPSVAVQGQNQTETQAELPPAAESGLDFLTPSAKPGSLGRLDHYEILEIMGRGGMGVVLKAFDEVLHRIVAVKVLAPQLATNATARKRFVREAQAGAAVCHDHVVTIHAVDEGKAVPYLVMQCVAGLSLQDKLDRDGPLGVKEILRIGMQTAEGLAAAHKQGLVHRDIKPANILLENGIERVKITDFGLARAVDDASVTQSGVIAGTPQYMSPEQAHGEAVDHRSDLFSLGSVLYAMCTGRPPFRATGSMAVLKRVCEDTPRPIREVNPDIPEWMCDIIAKLHAKIPADRCQSATEVAELLRQHLAHLQQPTLVPAPAPLVTISADKQTADSVAPRADHPQAGNRKRVRRALNGMGMAFVALTGPATIFAILAAPLHHETQAIISSLILVSTLVVEWFLFMTLRWGTKKSLKQFIVFVFLGTGALHLLGWSPKLLWDLWTQTGRPDQTPGSVSINWNDPEFIVILDKGQGDWIRSSKSPLSAPLNPGTYTLQAMKEGKILFEEKLSIAAGEQRTVNLSSLGWEPPLAKAPFTSNEAKALQAAWAKQLGEPVEIENSIGMKFRLIPPGEFLMGSSVDEKNRVLQRLSEDWQKGIVREELGPHRVQIPRAFYLSTHELTVGQFRKFITATTFQTSAERDGGGRAVTRTGVIERRPEWTWRHPDFAPSDDSPVVQISYLDAMQFCLWLTGVDGRLYFVPGENEWEFACRAGTQTPWPTGTEANDASLTAWAHPESNGKLHRPGGKCANAFGLFDMLGNVEEVCDSDTGSPTARGGHASLPLLLCRSASRVPIPASETYYRRGVRLAFAILPADADRDPPVAGVRFVERHGSVDTAPAEEQVKTVQGELKKLNPSFDGSAVSSINDGVITQFDVITDHVTDISPMRALSGLKQTKLWGSASGKSKLTDFSPLLGLPLNEITGAFDSARDTVVLRSMRNLSKINGEPAGEFWDAVDGQTAKAAVCLVRAWEFAKSGKWTEAEEEFSKAADAKPDDPQVWRWRAFFKAEAKHFDEAAADFNKALELAPRDARTWWGDRAGIDDTICRWDEVFNRVAKLRPIDANLWIARARWFAHRGRWKEAADATAEVLQRDPDNVENWFMDAPLRLQIGDVNGYRRDCREMLTRFGGIDNARTADYVAKTCLLLPDAVDNPRPAVHLAKGLDESRLDGSDKEQVALWFKLCRALARYRAGEFAPAVEHLGKIIQAKPNQASLAATAHALFAMAGHRAEYQMMGLELQKARELVEKRMSKADRGERFGDDWHDWLRCRILLREAETLIEGKPGSDE
jgi:formylglycine-generating enzyme required for sulfatase activity/tetratricopeptide (TPR) repeat protein